MTPYVITETPEAPLLTPGWYFARVFAFVGLGPQPSNFQGQTGMRTLCVLGFRLADAAGCIQDYWRQYTVSSSPRAALTQHMQQAQWLRDSPDKDLVKLVGCTAYVLFQPSQTPPGLPGVRIEAMSPASAPPADWHVDREAFHATGTFTAYLGDAVPEVLLARMPTWLADKLRAAAPVVPTGYGQHWAPPPPAASPAPPAPPAPPAAPPAEDDEGW